MRLITKTNWIIIFIVLAAAALAIGTASSVSSCCGRPEPAPYVEPFAYAAPDPVPVVSAEPVMISTPVNAAPQVCNTCVTPVTISAPVVAARPVVNNVAVQRPAYRMVRETEMREEEITTYETVWDEETRYRTRTVCKRVPETTIHRETVRVSKPVWETIEKETSYDVVRYVSETSEREEVKTVCKPVTEYQEKQIVETVNRPVQETVMQQRTRLVNRPVTTCETRTRDCGEYETQYVEKPGKEYTRLTWQRGGEYYDPATGRTRNRLPGLYWTDLTSAPEYTAQRVYKPRLVTETVPVTRMVEEQVVEDVPVTVNKVVQEQVVRTEQVPVTRMVEEKIVNKVPVTTYKPVTEKVVKKTPVRVCRMETVDEVRETPVTTYKMVTETIQEPYTVKVARQVPKTVKVQRPVTVCRRVPIDACAPVTVSSPETTVSKTVSEQTVTEPAESAAPADNVPQFNPGQPSASTSNYPSAENETITTDARSDLPAIPTEAPAQQNPEPSAAAPTVALPSQAADAPPIIEADRIPTLNQTTEPAAEPEVAPTAAPTEPQSEPQTEPVLPGIKRAEPAAPITRQAQRPIESILVPEPESKPQKIAMVEAGNESGEYFRFVGQEKVSDRPKPDIPGISPTQLQLF